MSKRLSQLVQSKKEAGSLASPHCVIRVDLLHKLTTEIATTAGVVGIEFLHVKGLIQNWRLSLSFSDAALGKLFRLLECKVTHRGGQVVKVDRFFPSSQLCHQCGWRWHQIQLSDRIFVCQHPDCLWSGDRDYNAAVNILNEALRLIGVALSGEVVPVVATTAPKTASGLGVRRAT